MSAVLGGDLEVSSEEARKSPIVYSVLACLLGWVGGHDIYKGRWLILAVRWVLLFVLVDVSRVTGSNLPFSIFLAAPALEIAILSWKGRPRPAFSGCDLADAPWWQTLPFAFVPLIDAYSFMCVAPVSTWL